MLSEGSNRRSWDITKCNPAVDYFGRCADHANADTWIQAPASAARKSHLKGAPHVFRRLQSPDVRYRRNLHRLRKSRS
ncbi:hypothetical protein BOSEA31B_12592 [Hyphomicrobiales bacterium]|nr:hypothetical protein BOSEA31B_12592 [Hyphomicrobiales bacterium]CAH1698361.1 hypothetical protein BOSEA1005_11414 [Hyphomicrobiales bacterium]